MSKSVTRRGFVGILAGLSAAFTGRSAAKAGGAVKTGTFKNPGGRAILIGGPFDGQATPISEMTIQKAHRRRIVSYHLQSLTIVIPTESSFRYEPRFAYVYQSLSPSSARAKLQKHIAPLRGIL